MSLSPPVTLAAIRAAAGDNVSAWASRAFSAALDAKPKRSGARWARWKNTAGKPLTWAEVEKICHLE